MVRDAGVRGADPSDALARLLTGHGFGPFFGTPCGILAPLYGRLERDAGMLTIPREDNAVGLAVGAALAGGRPVVVMQNSGFGQSVNALASLVVPYRVPVLLVVSMRGEAPDNTQENEAMGRLTVPLLEGMGIGFTRFGGADDLARVDGYLARVVRSPDPAGLLIGAGAFGWRP
jgi:sulfopyruvate decarboxylase subunit alpha